MAAPRKPRAIARDRKAASARIREAGPLERRAREVSNEARRLTRQGHPRLAAAARSEAADLRARAAAKRARAAELRAEAAADQARWRRSVARYERRVESRRRYDRAATRLRRLARQFKRRRIPTAEQRTIVAFQERMRRDGLAQDQIDLVRDLVREAPSQTRDKALAHALHLLGYHRLSAGLYRALWGHERNTPP